MALSNTQTANGTITNSQTAYGAITKGFHWLTALLILTAFPVGYFAQETAQYIQSADFDGSQSVLNRAVLLFSLHKTIGVAAFFTALLRILWALSQEKPGLLHPDRKLEAWAAETAHWVLYGAMLIVPLSGWIHHAASEGFAPIWWPLGQNLPLVPKSEHLSHLFSYVHFYAMILLGLTILAHVGGALKHHVIDRDSTLMRMLPGSRTLPEPPAQRHSAVPFFSAFALWVMVLFGASGLFLIDDAAKNHAAPIAQSPKASGWTVETGTLSITVVQMGADVSGQFTDWSAAINFVDPSSPGPAGDVDVTISIPSLQLGSVSGQAMGADYFNAEIWPTAMFQAEIFKLDDGYEARGTLTIRDQSAPLTLPFTLDLEGDTARMSGAIEVNRMEYDVGLGTEDEASLAYAVSIQVDVEARKTE
ncbi:MAG: cytochrome b/b6 domain-containing protein [Epibacterium sp.]|nr:cytochrome b/b6 domain-containing protein [Epibacterium sp.]NQX72768.1 cytochrome b/b6 domain-containing protein [Epibacterium sp.]